MKWRTTAAPTGTGRALACQLETKVMGEGRARVKVTATSLNVRSGPGQDFRKLGEFKRGDEVEIIERHEGWGWVKPGGGWVSLQFLGDEPNGLRAPSGLPEIRAMFGEPGGPLASAGRVQLPAPLKVGGTKKTVTSFVCHALVAAPFTRALNRLHEEGLWDDLETFDGCYNPRKKRKSGDEWSTHAWGISGDFKAATNQQGTKGNMSTRIVTVFEEEGFIWGGRFFGKSIDPMHFQFARNY